MDRTCLVVKKIRRGNRKPDKSNSAFKSGVISTSVKFSSERTGCIYSKVTCQKVGRDDFRPCITSMNEDGSNPKFCCNVPTEARASLASGLQESIKSGYFEESWEH